MIFYVEFTNKLFFLSLRPDFSFENSYKSGNFFERRDGGNSLKWKYVEGWGVHIKRIGTNKWGKGVKIWKFRVNKLFDCWTTKILARTPLGVRTSSDIENVNVSFNFCNEVEDDFNLNFHLIFEMKKTNLKWIPWVLK